MDAPNWLGCGRPCEAGDAWKRPGRYLRDHFARHRWITGGHIPGAHVGDLRGGYASRDHNVGARCGAPSSRIQDDSEVAHCNLANPSVIFSAIRLLVNRAGRTMV